LPCSTAVTTLCLYDGKLPTCHKRALKQKSKEIDRDENSKRGIEKVKAWDKVFYLS
jgi:hypothetical protein